MTAGTVLLSLAAVDLLWEDLGLDTTPVIFQVPSVGATLEERARIRADTFAELAGRGLMRNGEVDRRLAARLTLLGRAPVAIEALALLAGGTRLCARAASDGRQAVLAVQSGESLRINPIRHTALVPAMLDLIGPARPGPGRSVSYPTITDTRPAALLHRANGFDGQRQQAHTILAQPRTQTGLFIVLTRETPKPALLWFDTNAGRYLGHLKPGPDGQTWTTYAPTDNARLAGQLTALLPQDT